MRSRLISKLARPLWMFTIAMALLSLPLIEKRADLIILLPLAAWTVPSSTVRTIHLPRAV